MKKLALCLWVAALLLSAVGVGAEPICDRTRSFEHCYQSLRGPAPPPSTAVASAAALTKTLDAAEERITAASTPGTASSLLNLIPSSFASLGIAGLTDTSDSLSYDHVFDLGSHWKLDLGVTAFRDPGLFESLQKALPEENRSQLVETLSQDISDFAKTDGKLVLSWEGSLGDRQFGRDPERYADGLISTWAENEFDARVGADSDTLAQWGFNEAANAITAYGGEFFSDPIFEVASALNLADDDITRLEVGVRDAAEASAKTAKGLEDWLETFSEQVGKLITNQPQLLLEGKYDQRSDLTGPTQWSGRVCFEMGLSGNINDFRQWARQQVDKNGNHASDCKAADGSDDYSYSYACLQGYLGSTSAIKLGETAAKNRGHRLAIVAAYTKTQGLHLDRPDLDAEFDLDPSETWTGSLTYGLYLPKVKLPNLLWVFTPSAGSQPTGFARFDLEAKYDDVTGDPMKQSRFVATATLSQKMSDNTTLSLAAVYANKPQYLGEVDEEVSAHFGFKWSADKVDPKTN